MRIRTETEWTSIVDEFIDKTDAAKQQLLIEKTAILVADIYKRGELFVLNDRESKELSPSKLCMIGVIVRSF